MPTTAVRRSLAGVLCAAAILGMGATAASANPDTGPAASTVAAQSAVIGSGGGHELVDDNLTYGDEGIYMRVVNRTDKPIFVERFGQRTEVKPQQVVTYVSPNSGKDDVSAVVFGSDGRTRAGTVEAGNPMWSSMWARTMPSDAGSTDQRTQWSKFDKYLHKAMNVSKDGHGMDVYVSHQGTTKTPHDIPTVAAGVAMTDPGDGPAPVVVADADESDNKNPQRAWDVFRFEIYKAY